MSPLRTLRPIALIAAALLAMGVLAAPTAGAAVIVKPISFPVDGVVTYTDTFGACRGTACERRHEGQDLMGRKMMRLVAAVDGTVLRLVFSNTSSGGNSVTIKGADGWTYHYIHVNNDTPGTDDGKATRAQAFPANIVVGAKVTRGQLVAYMGDSGNAETTSPHLHFEIRQPPVPGQYTGVAINAYPSLQAASPATPAKWYLRTAPSTGGSKFSFAYGLRTDQALLCDWDADGLDEPVIYRAGTWYLRTGVNNAATARKITFGTAADTAQCADLDGDGIDEPALFQNGTWTVRTGFEVTGNVTWTGVYGTTGDRPVLGDWDGNGSDDLGVYRGNAWYLRSAGAAPGGTVHHYAYGRSTDLPVAADWDGDGADAPAVFRAGTWYAKVAASSAAESLPSFAYGASGDLPLAGVWEPTTSTNIGVYRPGV